MFAGRTFLIAEDERFTRLLLVRHLRSAVPADHYREPQLISVPNGRAALEALKSACVDVVFADLHMPDIDGLALLRAIRSGEAGVKADLPYVIVTGDRDPAPREAAVALQVNAYLEKPLSREAVRAFVRETFPAIGEAFTVAADTEPK